MKAIASDQINFCISATYPPFGFFNSKNHIVGFDIDIAKAICNKMKKDCIFTTYNFDYLIPFLKFKKCDVVISGIEITPERSKQISFTEPYHDNSATLILRKGFYTSLNNLKSKRIGVKNGTIYQRYLQEKYSEFKIVSYDNYQNVVLDLKNGRNEGIFGDSARMDAYIKNNLNLEIITKKITDPQYFGIGFGIAVHPDNKTLLDALNNALKEIKVDGTWKKINTKWFSHSNSATR